MGSGGGGGSCRRALEQLPRAAAGGRGMGWLSRVLFFLGFSCQEGLVPCQEEFGSFTDAFFAVLAR